LIFLIFIFACWFYGLLEYWIHRKDCEVYEAGWDGRSPYDWWRDICVEREEV